MLVSAANILLTLCVSFVYIQGVISGNETATNSSSVLQCYVCNHQVTTNCADPEQPESNLKNCTADQKYCKYMYSETYGVTNIVRSCSDTAVDTETLDPNCNGMSEMCNAQRTCMTDGCNDGDQNKVEVVTKDPGSKGKGSKILMGISHVVTAIVFSLCAYLFY